MADADRRPHRSQAGNIPGGHRDTLRRADFNDGTRQGFATDSGAFTVQSGVLQVTAASSSGDAVAVWYSDAYKSVYYELSARISMEKATGGWKANEPAVVAAPGAATTASPDQPRSRKRDSS